LKGDFDARQANGLEKLTTSLASQIREGRYS